MSIRSKILVLTIAGGLTVSGAGWLADAPIPGDRGSVASVDHPAPGSVDRIATGSVGRITTGSTDTGERGAPEDEGRTLRSALQALEDGDITGAHFARASLPKDSIDGKIIDWALARSGRSGVSAAHIEEALKELSDWPDRNRLQDNYERALSRERSDPEALARAFENSPPKTLTGAISLARAHKLLGDFGKARAALSPWWRSEPMDARSELLLLSEFDDVLTREDHRERFLAMMYRDRIRSAERVAEPAGTTDFLKPWAAAIRGQKDVLKLLDGASKSFKETPHHLFARIAYLRRTERDSDAAELLLQSPTDEAELVDPDKWWTERRIVSRDAFERGDIETAYRIAAMHRGGSAETQIDAAFHAGWYALRGLKDGAKAIPHFEKIGQLAGGAISRSRGAYWLGRAHAAAGSAEAESHFTRAAAFQTTYYGQLARHRLGLDLSDLRRPSVTADDMVQFREREPVAAMQRLEAVGEQTLARQLAVGLGRSLRRTSEITQLVAHLERQDQRQVALRIAKSAEWRGIRTGALTHPIGAIPASTPIDPAERPLAYAIARQESEFNIAARSPANALGLMQLLPGTAREVAQQTGLEYSRTRLDSDGAYNATLGTAYLNAQLDRFDGSYILTFAGYNAGPARALEWIKRFGDPRGKPLDEVIDWVESIPYPETRSYVQRVMENLQVYKARLGEPADIAGDLRFGRRS
ncbi:lytic transglycosylase domain-containing protein [Oricola cellulosilytica]|nr:lytic transglycosylase domain-containing protein [Oricola cellulosilytica]